MVKPGSSGEKKLSGEPQLNSDALPLACRDEVRWESRPEVKCCAEKCPSDLERRPVAHQRRTHVHGKLVVRAQATSLLTATISGLPNVMFDRSA